MDLNVGAFDKLVNFDFVNSYIDGVKKELKKNSERLINQQNKPSLDTYTKFVRDQNHRRRLEFEIMKNYSGRVLVDLKEAKRGYNRICLCGGQRQNFENSNLPVQAVRGESGKIFFSGLIRCGCVWRCPYCSYKISEHRRNELYFMVSEWFRRGGFCSFVTLTMRHRKKERLKDILDTLQSEFLKMQRTSKFYSLQKEFKILGFVKTLEMTYGGSGWHPHFHILLFYKLENEQLESKAYEEMHKRLIKMWCSREALQAKEEAQDAKVVYSVEGLTEYVSKWDMTAEMTKSNIKTTRGRISEKLGNELRGLKYTPFAMLRELACTDWDLKNTYQFRKKNILSYLFLEYSKATKGKHFIVVSKYLKNFFKEVAGEDMKKDEDILKDEKTQAVLFKVEAKLWDNITRKRLLYVQNLLNAYEIGGVECVSEYFWSSGVPVLFDFLKCEFYSYDASTYIRPGTVVYCRMKEKRKSIYRQFFYCDIDASGFCHCTDISFKEKNKSAVFSFNPVVMGYKYDNGMVLNRKK